MSSYNLYSKNPYTKSTDEIPPRNELTEEQAEQFVLQQLQKDSSLLDIKNPSHQVIMFLLKKDGMNLSDLDETNLTIEYCAEAFKSNIGSLRLFPKELLEPSIRKALTEMVNDPPLFNRFVAELDRRIDYDYDPLPLV